jgi:MoaA/NifB/PqqE/SkfB family radical SAM enzyme
VISTREPVRSNTWEPCAAFRWAIANRPEVGQGAALPNADITDVTTKSAGPLRNTILSIHNCGEIRSGCELLQFFKAEKPITSFDLQIATYKRTLSRSVQISLYEVDDDVGDVDLTPDYFSQLSSDSRPVISIHNKLWNDNEKFAVNTDPEIVKAGSRYAIYITSAGDEGDFPLTAWLHSSHERIPGHIQAYYGGRPQGEFGLLASVSYAVPRSSSRVPRAILYSPVTQCNLNCIHCISRESRSSKSVLCKSIKDDIRSWCNSGEVVDIRTDYSGDIFWADWKFGGELAFLRSLNVPYHIDTNGVHLSESASAYVLDSKLASLNISLDAATTTTFQRIRKGAPSLDVVIDNLKRFSMMRLEAKAGGRIRLSTSFTLMKSSLSEWEDFIRLSASCGVDVIYARHIEVFSEDMACESLVFHRDIFQKASHRARNVAEECGIEMAIPELSTTFNGRGHARCEVPWEAAVILGNGDVAVCCVPRTTVGNLNVTSMEELWNGPVYQEFRRRVNSTTPPPQCGSCPMMRNHSNIHSYLPFLGMESWVHPRDWGVDS